VAQGGAAAISFFSAKLLPTRGLPMSFPWGAAPALGKAVSRSRYRAAVTCLIAAPAWRRSAARLAASGGSLWIDRDVGYPIFRTRRPTLHARKLPRRTLAGVLNGPILELADGFALIGCRQSPILMVLASKACRINRRACRLAAMSRSRSSLLGGFAAASGCGRA
jgi:hypothetical protein